MPATINRHVAVMKQMFTKAAEWEMVEEERSKIVHKVKLLEENNNRLRFLSKDKCQALVKASDAHLRPIVICALNAGVRNGEIFGLKWDDVDLKHSFILLQITKNGEGREIPINRTLRATFDDPLRGNERTAQASRYPIRLPGIQKLYNREDV